MVGPVANQPSKKITQKVESVEEKDKSFVELFEGREKNKDS